VTSTGDDAPGEATVLIGPNKGRIVVTDSQWNEMDKGRASLYIPEDELESYDIESGQGDLTLPEPTSDRDRLQQHETFWEYLGARFAEQFDNKVDSVYDEIEGADDPLDAIMDLEPETLVVNTVGQDAE